MFGEGSRFLFLLVVVWMLGFLPMDLALCAPQTEKEKGTAVLLVFIPLHYHPFSSFKYICILGGEGKGRLDVSSVAGRSSPRAGSHRAAEPRAPSRPGSAVMGVSPLPARPQRLGAGRPQFRVSPRPPSASLSIPSLPPHPLPSPPFPCSASPLSPFCHWQPRGVRAPGARPSPPAFLILSLCLFSRRPHAGAALPRAGLSLLPASPPDAPASGGTAPGKPTSPPEPSAA